MPGQQELGKCCPVVCVDVCEYECAHVRACAWVMVLIKSRACRPELSCVPRIAAAPSGLSGDQSVMSVYGPPARQRREARRSQLPARQRREPSVIILTSIRVMITVNEIIHQAVSPLPGLVLTTGRQAGVLLCPSQSLSWGKGGGLPGGQAHDILVSLHLSKPPGWHPPCKWENGGSVRADWQPLTPV